MKVDLASKIKIFADGASIDSIKRLASNPIVKGFTTNPTLMRQAGIADYIAFSKEVLKVVSELPVSFEVFADDVESIENQARVIASWGDNVYVKIPVMTTKNEFLGPTIKMLSHSGIKLNITAVMTFEQVKAVHEVLSPVEPSIISVFAGRIADTGVDPLPLMKESVKLLRNSDGKTELLWASPRELLNVVQGAEIGCDIITVTDSIISKLDLIGKDLIDYSRETVQMFYNDAMASGYEIYLGPDNKAAA